MDKCLIDKYGGFVLANMLEFVDEALTTRSEDLHPRILEAGFGRRIILIEEISFLS